ncbi:hypothetical protein H0H81_010515 [Sphagnurus paluster]|uniref:Uncharacterized protein n=1 Tax=Sphagnurus paluster TaxID=117069 RepID=A0A9P7KHT9_9AGAR|nr:hypothetical protein H0H81_010515 [Sphagnurus paluster]
MNILSYLLLISSVIAAGFAATISDVRADIKTVATSMTGFDNAIEKLPAKGSIFDALAIKSLVDGLERALDKTTTDIKATPAPFTDADSIAILSDVKDVKPTILHILSNSITKKSNILNLPVPGINGLIRDSMQSLQGKVNNFENALIAASADSVKLEGVALKAELDAEFLKTIKAYS